MIPQTCLHAQSLTGPISQSSTQSMIHLFVRLLAHPAAKAVEHASPQVIPGICLYACSLTDPSGHSLAHSCVHSLTDLLTRLSCSMHTFSPFCVHHLGSCWRSWVDALRTNQPCQAGLSWVSLHLIKGTCQALTTGCMRAQQLVMGQPHNLAHGQSGSCCEALSAEPQCTLEGTLENGRVSHLYIP